MELRCLNSNKGRRGYWVDICCKTVRSCRLYHLTSKSYHRFSFRLSPWPILLIGNWIGKVSNGSGRLLVYNLWGRRRCLPYYLSLGLSLSDILRRKKSSNWSRLKEIHGQIIFLYILWRRWWSEIWKRRTNFRRYIPLKR